MTRVGMYDQIRKAFQDIIAPELAIDVRERLAALEARRHS
jgi:hypothetical protein